jgi:hypothetical protein
VGSSKKAANPVKFSGEAAFLLILERKACVCYRLISSLEALLDKSFDGR